MPNQSNAIAALIVSTNGIVKIMIAVQHNFWTLFWKNRYCDIFHRQPIFHLVSNILLDKRHWYPCTRLLHSLWYFAVWVKWSRLLLQKSKKQSPIQLKYIFNFPIRSLIEIYRVLGLMFYCIAHIILKIHNHTCSKGILAIINAVVKHEHIRFCLY